MGRLPDNSDALLSRCFCKAGRRLIFFLWLRPGFCAKISRNAIINKNIASSRDTKTLRKIDSAIFRFSPRLRRGDTGRGGAPLGKGDGGLRKNTCRGTLHKRGVGVSSTKIKRKTSFLLVFRFYYINFAPDLSRGAHNCGLR